MTKVDLSGQIYAALQKALAQAKQHWQAGRGTEAAAAYRRCAELMRQYADYALNKDVKQQRLERARRFLELAEKIEEGRAAMVAAETAAGPDYEAEVVPLIHRSGVAWEDIGGLEETKREIQAAYALGIVRQPQGVQVRGWRNILLYGPPGTGKTLLAAAASNELDATFFNVKVSDMVSKYFGESTKLISALYRVADQKAPAVVFLDEFDSLTPPRGGGESGAERRILSTLLSELDGLADKTGKGETSPYVLTIAATNVPWLIDKAVLSRFGAKLIYVPLPDDAARQAILRIHLEGKGHKTKVSHKELVARSEGCSGREIEGLCQEAVNHMVQRMNPELFERVDMGREALSRYKLKLAPLVAADFDHAFERARPKTTLTDIAGYEKWQESLA